MALAFNMTVAERRLVQKLFAGMALYIALFFLYRFAPDDLFAGEEE